MGSALRLCRNVARVALGFFIAWQLCFLLAANFLGIAEQTRTAVADEPTAKSWTNEWLQGEGPVYETYATCYQATLRWAEFSGQPQNWSLFAPGVTAEIPFLAVEFRWDDDPLSAQSVGSRLAPLAAIDPFSAAVWHVVLGGQRPAHLPPPQLLLSENEPADPYHFLRVGNFRLRRLESALDIALATPQDKRAEEMADSWRDTIQWKVRKEAPALRAYLEWRLQRFRFEHPELPPPKQVILLVRLYHVPPPGTYPWAWRGPEQRPFARWRPGT